MGRSADRGPADVRARQEALGYGLMRDGNGPRALDTVGRSQHRPW